MSVIKIAERSVQAEEQVVEILKGLLERAKKGEFQSVVAVLQQSGSTAAVNIFSGSRDTFAMLGHIEMMRHQVVGWLDGTKVYEGDLRKEDDDDDDQA